MCPKCGYTSPAKNKGDVKSLNVKKLGVVAVVSAVAAVAVLFLILGKTPLSSISISDQVGITEPNSLFNETSSLMDNDENTSAPDVDASDDTENKPILAPLAELFQPTKRPSLSELKQYALQRINEDRAKFGLSPVELGSNRAAQIHAEDVFKTKRISHWMTNGEKPYMTYSRTGGLGDVGQNVAVQGYKEEDATACKYGLAMCTHTNPKDAIDKAEFSMVYDDKECCDDGHRDNILDKHHTHVSLGIAYDNYYFAYVQNFENQYISWSQPITYDNDLDKVSMKGTLLNNVSFTGINVFYDPLPTESTYLDHKDDSFYSLGDRIGIVAEPPLIGYYYTEDENKSHVTVIADTWTVDNSGFEISFPMQKLSTKYGDGVYTVVIFAEDASIEFSSTSLSIVIE
jgi:uncharacterized protein YkwD